MALTLHLHPLSSYCHKVLIALYENETPFKPQLVNPADPESRAAFLKLSPMGKMPALRDDTRDRSISETTIIIEYLDRHYPGARPLLPADEDSRLDVRSWDRFMDLYVHTPMQKFVGDKLRPADERDARGITDAGATLNTAYKVLDDRLQGRTWLAADSFTMADCSASPALFYAAIVMPIPAAHAHLSAYFERLMSRGTVKRVLDEARPYFEYYPFKDSMPERFRNP